MSHRLDHVCERIARLDARVRQAPGQLSLDLSGRGKGQPCGQGWISKDKTCQKGKGAAKRKAAAKAKPTANASLPSAEQTTLGSDDKGQLLVNGKPPRKALGGGAFGDTYVADTADGPIVIKVDRLSNGDPLEMDPRVDRKTQRRNMVERERSNMQKAFALGVGPEPVGEVTELLGGRLAFAYRMQPGTPMAKDHRAIEATPEAQAIMAKPGSVGRYAKGVARLARVMADAGLDHGDLHGGNILIGPDGTPSLIDWGMARQVKNTLPHEIAKQEAATLFVMGGTMINTNAEVGRVGRRPKPSIVKFINAVQADAWNAERAYKKVIENFDDAWREANGDEKVPNALQRITEANALVKAGMEFDEAERKVGLLPPLPNSVRREAERARDRVFGPDHLRRFRRTIDRHYAAWEKAD
jgi:hypothetical protein